MENAAVERHGIALDVDVEVACDAASVPSPTEFNQWASRTLAHVTESGSRELSVRIVDEAEIQHLNATYRCKDSPTNVLAFPVASESLAEWPDSLPRPLGDLVLCASVVEREAEEQDKPAAEHWAHLTVHGTLHLLGFDHVTERGAIEMEGLEVEILAAGGIANPYRTRQSS